MLSRAFRQVRPHMRVPSQDPIEFRDLNIVMMRERLAQLKVPSETDRLLTTEGVGTFLHKGGKSKIPYQNVKLPELECFLVPFPDELSEVEFDYAVDMLSEGCSLEELLSRREPSIRSPGGPEKAQRGRGSSCTSAVCCAAEDMEY